MDSSELKIWIEKNGILTYSRSGGPGGQYVNTSDTKAVLHLPLYLLPVSTEAHERLLSRLSNSINARGELVIHASDTRSQAQNRAHAQRRALKLVLSALEGKRTRRPTRPTNASRQRRITAKKNRSRKKELRKKPSLNQ